MKFGKTQFQKLRRIYTGQIQEQKESQRNSQLMNLTIMLTNTRKPQFKKKGYFHLINRWKTKIDSVCYLSVRIQSLS